MFEKEVLEVLKSINENLVKLIETQENANRLALHSNIDGMPKTD